MTPPCPAALPLRRFGTRRDDDDPPNATPAPPRGRGHDDCAPLLLRRRGLLRRRRHYLCVAAALAVVVLWCVGYASVLRRGPGDMSLMARPIERPYRERPPKPTEVGGARGEAKGESKKGGHGAARGGYDRYASAERAGEGGGGKSTLTRARPTEYETRGGGAAEPKRVERVGGRPDKAKRGARSKEERAPKRTDVEAKEYDPAKRHGASEPERSGKEDGGKATPTHARPTEHKTKGEGAPEPVRDRVEGVRARSRQRRDRADTGEEETEADTEGEETEEASEVTEGGDGGGADPPSVGTAEAPAPSRPDAAPPPSGGAGATTTPSSALSLSSYPALVKGLVETTYPRLARCVL